MHSLDRLFNPRSIAVVGASSDEYKAGYQMLFALRNFPGELYPVNPKEDTLLGLKTSSSLKAIGKPVDLVILTIPAANSLSVLKEAGEAGAGAALIISGGFAETGETGQKAQQEIISVCRKYNIRLLGPNTAGFVNPEARVSANFNPWIGELSPGPIGLVSQSGAMCLVLAAYIRAHELGVSLATGIGNGADLDMADIIEYLAADEKTKVIVLYLEGIRDGRRLYEVIQKTTEKKPVLVLTVGKGDIAEFAVSHTGNLIGSYKMKKSVLKQAGAVIVETSDDLIDAADLFSRTRLGPDENPGLGLLTGQAGPGMIITDFLRSKGVLIPELKSSTVEKIRQELPPLTYIKNPVDTARPGPSFSRVLSALATDPSIDVLIAFVLHEPAVIDPVVLFKEVRDRIKQPLIFGTSGFPEDIHPVQKSLAGMNIASFASPDRTARAVLALVEDAKAAYRKTRRPEMPSFLVDIEPLRRMPDEAEAKDILNRIGIPTPRRVVCRDHEEAKKAFYSLSKPCVVKVLDAAIAHKTEIGGVFLGIETEKKLLDALGFIDRISTGSEKKRYLIEETAGKGLEIIIGATNDPAFGPVVLIGLGGTAAEALGDTAMRLAPLDHNEALDMIWELKGRSLFEGWRGSPHLDTGCIADALVRIGHLMTYHPEIREMDLNPVRIYEKGLMALDALILVEERAR